MSLRVELPAPEDTDALGVALARALPAKSLVVYLQGDLGAGKSTLARSLLRELGVTGAIRSPTYTLVERYPLPEGGEAAHLDLYRIAAAGELDFLGLDELRSARLWLVEWPERGAGALPSPDVEIRLGITGGGRTAELQESSEKGRSWLARFSKNAPSRGSV